MTGFLFGFRVSRFKLGTTKDTRERQLGNGATANLTNALHDQNLGNQLILQRTVDRRQQADILGLL